MLSPLFHIPDSIYNFFFTADGLIHSSLGTDADVEKPISDFEKLINNLVNSTLALTNLIVGLYIAIAEKTKFLPINELVLSSSLPDYFNRSAGNWTKKGRILDKLVSHNFVKKEIGRKKAWKLGLINDPRKSMDKNARTNNINSLPAFGFQLSNIDINVKKLNLSKNQFDKLANCILYDLRKFYLDTPFVMNDIPLDTVAVHFNQKYLVKVDTKLIKAVIDTLTNTMNIFKVRDPFNFLIFSKNNEDLLFTNVFLYSDQILKYLANKNQIKFHIFESFLSQNFSLSKLEISELILNMVNEGYLTRDNSNSLFKAKIDLEHLVLLENFNKEINGAEIHFFGHEILKTLISMSNDLENTYHWKDFHNKLINLPVIQSFKEIIDEISPNLEFSFDIFNNTPNNLIQRKFFNKKGNFIRPNTIDSDGMIRSVVNRYLTLTKNLTTHQKLQMGIITIPSRSISELDLLRQEKKIILDDESRINEIKLLLSNLGTILKLIQTWKGIKQSTLLDFLRKTLDYVAILNNSRGERYIQLIESLLSLETTKSKVSRGEEFSIIVRALTGDLISSFLIYIDTKLKRIDILKTIDNIANICDSEVQKELIVKIANSNHETLKSKLILGISNIFMPIEKYTNFDELIGSSFNQENLKSFSDIGISDPMFIQGVGAINGIADILKKSPFTEGYIATEKKFVKEYPDISMNTFQFNYLSGNYQWSFVDHETKFMYHEKLMKTMLGKKVTFNLPQELLQAILLIHMKLMKYLFGVHKNLEINFNRNFKNKIDSEIFSFYTVVIPFVQNSSILQINKFENFLTNLNPKLELHVLEQIFDIFGWRKINSLEYELKTVDTFREQIGDIVFSKNMKIYNNWGSQRGKPEATFPEYPYHLESIRLFYIDVINLNPNQFEDKFLFSLD